MDPSDYNQYQWTGQGIAHTPRGRICTWTHTPLATDRLSTTLLVVLMHHEKCGV